MKSEPTITVITVCYNSGASLNRALKSVQAQSWSKIEHIVIDGGSTDDTLKILELNKEHLAYYSSEPDKGIYDAMNKGLDRATGDIICFLNADDYYSSEDVLSRVAKLMSEFELDALMGDVTFFHAANPERIVRRYRSDRFTPQRLAWGWMPAHPALFLCKSIVQRVGGFKTDYRIAGDFDYIARVFHGHKLRCKHLPDALVHMQTGGASTVDWRAKLLLNREVLRSCRENGISTNLFMVLSKYPLKLLEFLIR